ncbi:hypothetical protein Tco_1202368 [Tanacetum coccineum]
MKREGNERCKRRKLRKGRKRQARKKRQDKGKKRRQTLGYLAKERRKEYGIRDKKKEEEKKEGRDRKRQKPYETGRYKKQEEEEKERRKKKKRRGRSEGLGVEQKEERRKKDREKKALPEELHQKGEKKRNFLKLLTKPAKEKKAKQQIATNTQQRRRKGNGISRVGFGLLDIKLKMREMIDSINIMGGYIVAICVKLLCCIVGACEVMPQALSAFRFMAAVDMECYALEIYLEIGSSWGHVYELATATGLLS